MVLLGLIPDLSGATALPTVRCLPSRGLPFASSLGYIPGPALDWCLPSNDETESCLLLVLLPGTCSQACLLLFFLLRVLGYLLLFGFQLICSHPSTEHRKVSHGHSEAFLLCTGGWCRSSHHPEFCSIYR